MDNRWIEEGLKKPGKTKAGLARVLGRANSAVTQLLQGNRRLQIPEIEKIARYLEVDPPDPLPRINTVPLRGYVGAGAEAHYFSAGDDPNEEVEAPDTATAHTVAVEVRGESLGALFDRWLVFYDEIRDPPTFDMVGKLCVVGLADGRVLVKQMKRSPLGLPHVHLYSNVEAPIYDAVVTWAAVVRQMTPR
jgi:transcriptional regulator with XRE-family HTH domain